MQISTIAIIGGLGKTGGRVAERLNERGITVRAASRSTTPRFDWQDRSTWHKALEDSSAAYVTFQPDLSVDWAAEAIATLAKTAAEAGVGHIVLLSGRGEDGALRSEEKLKAVGVDYTVLRASWFNQNFSEGAFVDGLLQGKLALPAGDVPEPFVDADDIADAAVECLTDPRHRNQTYELTGPRALTFRQAVSEIATASNRTIEYETVPIDAFIAEMTAYGLPLETTDLLRELFTEVLDGRNSPVMDGVRQILGRQAKDFSDYARQTAATGIWSVQS
ncbi:MULTISPECIES: NmrA family NAD(P)-binding protein [unclassified Rhizobium]|uniref:SDR family oxidoreductase n=1 Tax=unclassified Rhizobium TaxID=2613769 RepID=UPI000EA95092|nr:MULTISPECIES: NmrA family NAD(P)-binding protein [unclassified Rhizobium]AYG65098.1 NmrA family transcriptional regulator [Rhizobium sp. CCGE531]AYG71582.1 NmrA family transcriptional regulator [Rhizobium sp. CCGE532]